MAIVHDQKERWESVDVAIVGGGPAGLSAGLMLGRAIKKTLIIDEGRPRNAVTRTSHGFLTRDGIRPDTFRRIAKEQLGAYPSVSHVNDTVKAVAGEDGHFVLHNASGTKIAAKKLLFAVGMKDRKPDIPGLAEVYGTSAFVCPYCDGWELRNEKLVVISQGAALMHFVPLLSGWTKKLVVCTNGPDELTEAERGDLRDHQIPLFDTPIRNIESTDGMVRRVILEDGTEILCTGIFFKPDLVPGTDLPKTLGCRFAETGVIDVNDEGKTSVPGVYAAGDVTTFKHQLMTAAASGAIAAAAINAELNQEMWRKPRR